MRILHYALGFPPYRSGGLTKFCMDLMEQQAKEGHTVGMIWPGEIKFVGKKVAVKKHNDVNLHNQRIQSFEVVNPLPVSYDEGIADFGAFTKDAGRAAYDNLFLEVNPDVIHIHTLMGLHKSFLQAAKDKGIRLVFTAHDFFPICPKVTLFRHGAICNCVHNCENCGVCNATALGLNKIKILQAPIYRELKESKVVKRIRKQHRDNYLSEATANDAAKPVGTPEDYIALQDYYYSLLKLMDIIHYNSNVTKSVYESAFNLPSNCVLSITHSDIEDNRRVRSYSDDYLRIRYLGPQSGAKGFFLLKKALDELWIEKKDFCLDVHFIPKESAPYIKTHGRYSYDDLEKIFDETDILVAPSIWYETFGFTVLEALSYGVPVIISENVGAKDILVNGAGIIVESNNKDALREILKQITHEKLMCMNEVIVTRQSIMQIGDMSKLIDEHCYFSKHYGERKQLEG